LWRNEPHQDVLLAALIERILVLCELGGIFIFRRSCLQFHQDTGLIRVNEQEVKPSNAGEGLLPTLENKAVAAEEFVGELRNEVFHLPLCHSGPPGVPEHSVWSVPFRLFGAADQCE